MLLYLSLLIRILSNPFSNVFQKKLGEKGLNSLYISFFAYFILSVFCIIPSFSVHWAQFDSALWINVLLAGIIGALGNWFLVEAMKIGELSVLGPINAYKSVVSVVFAFIILRELPHPAQFLGIILIALGSYVIFDTQREKFTLGLLLRRDIRYRIFALVLTALEAVFIKKIIVLSDVAAAFILWSVFSALFSFVILLIKKENLKVQFSSTKGKNLSVFFLLALSMFLMQMSTNFVFERMNVASALALFQLSALISVILGWRYFREKNILRKILGTLIMIAGASVVILF